MVLLLIKIMIPAPSVALQHFKAMCVLVCFRGKQDDAD